MSCNGVTLACVLATSVSLSSRGEVLTVRAPSRPAEVSLAVEAKGLSWALAVNGKDWVLPSDLGLKFKGGKPSSGWHVVRTARCAVDETRMERLYRRERVRDCYNELTVDLEAESGSRRRLGLVFRVYDNAVAFRYRVPEQAGERQFVIEEELTRWTFPGDPLGWFAAHRNFATSQEEPFFHRSLKSVGDFGRHFNEEFLVGAPAVVETDGGYVAVTEAALVKWSGMFLSVDSRNGDRTSLCARLAPRLDNIGLVVREAPAESPWRVTAFVDKAVELTELGDVLRDLNPPPEGGEAAFGWVRPGACSWDWWVDSNHALTLEGEAFEKRLIDLAAEMGWRYHLIDGGWYGRPVNGETVVLEPRSGLDLAGLLASARAKGVGIFLWTHWRTLDANGIEETFAKFERWGVSGVKIDFMNRSDQEMVQWYEKVIRSAARHHLLVNYHGAFKPTGTERTWPNNLTREGVLGNENVKFNARCNPMHHAVLPFTRLALGAADFTPGGFDNVYARDFVCQGLRGHDYFDHSAEGNRNPVLAQEMGTRAHALALCVAYDSPLQTMCDWPERYRNAPGAEILRNLPTVWRDTRPVCGEIGSHYAVLRESFAGDFYFAAFSVGPRTVPLSVDFLGDGTWEMTQYVDDPVRTPTDAKALAIVRRTVVKGETISFEVLAEGGAVAVFRKVK